MENKDYDKRNYAILSLFYKNINDYLPQLIVLRFSILLFLLHHFSQFQTSYDLLQNKKLVRDTCRIDLYNTNNHHLLTICM